MSVNAQALANVRADYALGGSWPCRRQVVMYTNKDICHAILESIHRAFIYTNKYECLRGQKRGCGIVCLYTMHTYECIY